MSYEGLGLGFYIEVQLLTVIGPWVHWHTISQSFHLIFFGFFFLFFSFLVYNILLFFCVFFFCENKIRGREGRAGGPAAGVWGGAEQSQVNPLLFWSILYPQGDQREQGAVTARVSKGPGPRETSHNGAASTAIGSIWKHFYLKWCMLIIKGGDPRTLPVKPCV